MQMKKITSLFRQVECPVCHSHKTHFSRYNGSLEYFRCRRCNTWFIHPMVSPETLEKMYSNSTYVEENRKQLSIDDLFDDSQWIIWQKNREGYLLSLDMKTYELQLAPRKPSVLEIGCAEGRQLEIFQKWGWETYGLEMNQYGVEASQKIGLKVCQGACLDDLPIQWGGGGMFDCIIMSHVIEHLPDPRECIRQCYEKLSSNGVLILETPIPPHDYNDKYHMFLFSEGSLELILNQAGFQPWKNICMKSYEKDFRHMIIRADKKT